MFAAGPAPAVAWVEADIAVIAPVRLACVARAESRGVAEAEAVEAAPAARLASVARAAMGALDTLADGPVWPPGVAPTTCSTVGATPAAGGLWGAAKSLCVGEAVGVATVVPDREADPDLSMAGRSGLDARTAAWGAGGAAAIDDRVGEGGEATGVVGVAGNALTGDGPGLSTLGPAGVEGVVLFDPGAGATATLPPSLADGVEPGVDADVAGWRAGMWVRWWLGGRTAYGAMMD